MFCDSCRSLACTVNLPRVILISRSDIILKVYRIKTFKANDTDNKIRHDKKFYFKTTCQYTTNNISSDGGLTERRVVLKMGTKIQ